MATVCVGCGLDVDTDGKLIVQIAPDSPCRENHLVCTPTGLEVRQKRRYLRRSFSADGSSAVTSTVGPAVSRLMSLYGTVEDNGSSEGLWSIQGDGSILINCDGMYHVTQQTIIRGSTGQVLGGRARVIEGSGGGVANIIASHEFNDRNNAVDLADPTDGPEFNASNIRHLQVGDVITYIANAYLFAVGQDVDWDGEFTITYLGEFG